ncbi:replicative helicase loader/inhibitor [Neobacillus drentensis]|uniref:replicative helicase loader/inhibitor n=1 Tax=Neobacillus drentensis TaxID=220684 RepID=UPI003B58AF1B
MIKRETFALLTRITVFYDQFEVNQEKVNLWHEVLREYPLTEIQGNLLTFVRNSSYPPKLAELIACDNRMKRVPTWRKPGIQPPS